MSTKFTPGPWHVQRGNSSNPMVGTDEVSIAEVLDDVHPDTEQQEANARLIAAAPELLAACQMLLARIEQLQDQWGKEGFTDATARLLREAIAKAAVEAK